MIATAHIEIMVIRKSILETESAENAIKNDKTNALAKAAKIRKMIILLDELHA
jgi:hypothetical protein